MFKTIHRFLNLFERYIICQEKLLACQQKQLKITKKQSERLQSIAANFTGQGSELPECEECEQRAGREVSRSHEVWCSKHG